MAGLLMLNVQRGQVVIFFMFWEIRDRLLRGVLLDLMEVVR